MSDSQIRQSNYTSSDPEETTSDRVFEREVYENFARLERQDLKHRRASLLEICATVIAVAVVILSQIDTYNSTDAIRGSLFRYLATNPIVSISSFVVFIQIFNYTLTNKSLFLSLIVSLNKLESGLNGVISAAFNPILSEFSEKGTGTDRRESAEGDSPRDPMIEMLRATRRRSPAEVELRVAVQRSSETARSSQRRPNALIGAGATVAVLGVLLFILTLNEPKRDNVDWLQHLIEISPRIVLFLFVQVLAGFFLRQYRSSLEDFRYYEALHRSREDRLSAYLIVSGLANEGDDLRKIVEKLTENRDVLRLTQGETTISLEAQRMEKNEFSTMADAVLNALLRNKEQRNDELPK